MKKLTLFLVAMFAMVNIANAQRAWAYDLELTPSVDSYTFAFKAVTAGDATLVFYKEGVEAGTLNLGSVSAGANTVTKTSEELLAAIQQSGNFTWGVKMSAGAIAADATLSLIKSHIYYNMMGVVTDLDTESKNFGRVYLQMSFDGKPTYGSTKQTAGFFEFDPLMNLLSDDANNGVKPQLPQGYTSQEYKLDGSSRDQFHRLHINPKTGDLVFSHNIANKPGVFAVNPDNLSGDAKNLLDGITGLTGMGSTLYRTSAHCFDNDGALFVMDIYPYNDSGYANGKKNYGYLYKIVDGQAVVIDEGTKWANASIAMASDGRGGLWIAQNRSQIDGYYQLAHIKDGVDFAVDEESDHGFSGAAERGAVAYDQVHNILAWGRERKVMLFDVSYDETTGIPMLTKIAETEALGRNIDCLAFDYAGDLYVGSSSSEIFYKYAVPTNNNTCTTPAKKSQVIKLESITLNAHPVKDYSASIVGTMKRAIQNGENTIILTHEANGTAHIYNIAHATKTITEISQEGVIAVDPDNAGDYLAISDIALTEDGKLIASNYMRCEQGTTPATGYKVGEIRYYIWNDITAAPTRWFTTNKTANSTYADVSYTFAIKGTSTNAQLMSTAVHNNNRAARINLHTVVNGTESAYHRFGLHTTASEYTEAKQGVNFQLTAVPLDGVWALEGELTDPTSFAVPSATGAEYNGTALNGINLGKKYNGANYLDYNDHLLMVAPYAVDGKLAGVKVLGITDGFDAANLVITNTDLANTIDATSAAATAYVDGDGDLTIYLFADSKVYAFSEKEYTAATYTVTATANEGGSVEGGGTYDEGATATLTATPAEHYEFTGWTGDVESTDNPLIVAVNSDMNITANFVKKKYTLTVFVNDENKGTIDVATGSHEYGTEVTLTATPKEGYKLLAWSNKATTPSITLTMDNNKAVSAYFVKEYATDPTFTIEKVWENTNVPAATANGFQGVGWDGKIYVKDRYNAAINVYTETGSELYAQLGATVTGLAGDQPIAVDDAGNLVVRSGSTNFYDSPTQVSIFRKNENTPEVIDFTLPATGRCDFISASGDIFGEKGGYVYFFCMNQTTVSRLHIKNGEYKGVDTIAIVAEEGKAASQSHVVVDIYGNIHTSSKGKNAYEYNITTLTTTADPYLGAATKKTPKSTIGGCTFELGGKELWAYVAGTTNYSSEWELKNVTDGVLVSDGVLYAKDKTTVNSNPAANWLNVQVVDEKTAYIYQFCPTVAAAVWKVSLKENYIVSVSATNGTVTGTGTYQEGATATLTATPNTGYKFVNWTKGGEVVSTDATYSFPVTENVELVANFEAITSKDPRAWAYDMKLGEEGDNYTFTFKATTAGDATITFNDKDGNALAQPASQTMAAAAGENKFTIAKSDFESGVDAFWSITMDGAPIEGVVEVTDQSRGIYDFYNMMGVVVDNNTDSKDFGKIYVQQSYQRSYATSEAKNDGITARANEQTSGIFVYNQDLDELNDPSNVGLKPTMPAGYTEIGSSSSAFQRLNIHPKTGNLVFSHAVSGKPAVFAINRDDITGDVTNLLTGVADMTRSVAHCFDAEGTLYVMDFAGSTGAVYKVINGEATRITEISAKFINAYITMASDGRDGLWISQNRGQMDDAPYYYQLVHVTSTGEFDWYVNKETPHGLDGSSSRGALAYDVERKILAQGRNGKVELYTVSYEPTITLTPLHTIASNDLGNNIDGLAFDYAGDLYVVNSSKEKFQKFTLPTADNICTVAAPSSEAIRFTPVYTVSVESKNNEWGIVSGGGTFEEGETATITAVAATNYKFVNWTKDDAEVSTENPYTFAVTESATYVANFEEITKYTINVTIMDDAKMGTVEGAGTYYEGTEVTLTAKANGGYVFVDWSDGNTEETRTIEVTSDLNLTANFKVAVPRAWAYDLRKGEDGENYTFTFKTTSAGTATLIFKDKDGNTQDFGAHTATATEAREQTITIEKTVFDAATNDIYWEVELAGDAIAKMAEITDPTKGIYDIVAPQGIAVDNNTDSKHFGQVYVAAATDGTVSRGAQTRGIFVYDPILNELNSPNAGYLPANATLTSNTRQAIHRVAVNPTNNQVAFAYNISGSSAIWSMNPENLAGDAVDLIEGAGITKANSLCFDEAGSLYVMDNANVSTGGKIYRIQDGVADVFANVQAGYNWVTEENTIVSDGRGGLWIAQNRWQVDGYPALSHVDKTGIVDFAVTSSSPEALKALFPHDDNNASYRGQCAYYVADDILAFGGNKEAVLFKVTYDINNVPTNLEKLMSTGKLGTNIDGLAFDYAGDLYVASETTHRMYKFVIPTADNTCTVPAPESQFIQKETRYTVTVVVNDNAMGTAIGGGTDFLAGDIATLSATANDGYQFVKWTKAGAEVSTNATYTFTVTEDVELVANFEEIPAPRAITYELNGGQYNQYSWENKGDICLALEADYNATYGTSKDWVQKVDDVIQYNINGTWMTEEEAKGQESTVAGFLQASTYNTTDNLKKLIETTMVDKYGWLKDVIVANREEQSVAGELSEAIYRKELSAFFLHSPSNASWPSSSSYEEIGELITFQTSWTQKFPNPTHPNSTVTLNAPYKEGYLFDGWYATSDFSGAEVTTVDETTNGTLYAKWLEHFYTRTVTSGDFGTICLPYGSSSYSGAEFYEIAYLELEADETTPKGIWLNEAPDVLEAGKPYIFKATSNLLTVNYEGVEVSYPIEGTAGLTGTFDAIPTTNSILEGNYMIADNKFWLCGTGCWLNANRAYIDKNTLHNNTTPVAAIPGRRRVMMGAAGENTTTGIDNLTEGGAIVPNMEGTYDVLGRKMNEPNNTGFYIVNGKKVVIVK